MKDITLVIDNGFLKQKHIDENIKWDGESGKHWVSSDTDTFEIEECYLDSDDGSLVFTVITDGCYVRMDISFLTLLEAMIKGNFYDYMKSWINKAQLVKKRMADLIQD